ncbi:hypothetical protein [Papillibacter cinnamivorans]|nr:hypothetical protein [Papillibacter cinnamivorans]
MKKLIGIALAVTMVLSMTVMVASAAGNDYSRFNNPGKGHDWSTVYDGNSNDNSNTQHNENGYQNHIPSLIAQ